MFRFLKKFMPPSCVPSQLEIAQRCKPALSAGLTGTPQGRQVPGQQVRRRAQANDWRPAQDRQGQEEGAKGQRDGAETGVRPELPQEPVARHRGDHSQEARAGEEEARGSRLHFMTR